MYIYIVHNILIINHFCHKYCLALTVYDKLNKNTHTHTHTHTYIYIYIYIYIYMDFTANQ